MRSILLLCLACGTTGCSSLLASRRAAAKAPAESGPASRPTQRVRGATADRAGATAGAGSRAADIPLDAPLEVEPPTPEPDATASDSAGVARLVRLSHVWQTVSLHHPWVATRGVPWDSGFIIAAPRVRASADDAQLTEAYRRLFALLRDTRTRVVPVGTVSEPEAIAISTDRVGDSLVVIRIAPSAPLDAPDSVLVTQELQRLPRRVLLDLRGRGVLDGESRAERLDQFLERTGLAARLVRGTVSAPVVRTRRIGVWPAGHDALNVREFHDGWQVRETRQYRGTAVAAMRTAVLADSGTVLPGVVLAMHDAAQLSLFADGGLRDAAPVPTVRVPLSDALTSIIRTGELVHADGSLDVVPDSILVHRGDADVARSAAIAVLQSTARLPLADRPFPALVSKAQTPVFYDTTSYPFMGARLLGGVRLWSAMRTRHGQRDLYDDDLDAVFARVIPRLEAARSSTEYATAIADLATVLDDVSGQPRGASYEAAIGGASLPFRVRLADGRAFVSDVVRDSTTTRLSIGAGTELLTIDGFPIAAWLLEHRRTAPASNDWTRALIQARQMPRGRAEEVSVRVRDATNRERTLTVPRRAEYLSALPTFERAPAAPARALADGVVYIDMEQLTESTINTALAGLTGARGLIIDLRGTLTVDETPLLRRLATQPRAQIARVVQRALTEPCFASIREAATACPDIRESRGWFRAIDTSTVFSGRIVALIDERTSDAMERLALTLDQMSRITLIGSASAGSISPVTPLSLPGGLTVGIATQEWRRGDGAQIQRVGLTPFIDVRPTARGLRSLDDEVLTRALQWMQQQLEPARRRR